MGKKILVVDDAAAIRQAASLILSESGYDIIEANDGKDALVKLSQSGADLVLCDVNMPVMNGIEFLEELKNNSAYAAYKFIPIIMLTTESGAEMKQKGKELGARAWLVKPFRPDELIKSIERLLF